MGLGNVFALGGTILVHYRHSESFPSYSVPVLVCAVGFVAVVAGLVLHQVGCACASVFSHRMAYSFFYFLLYGFYLLYTFLLVSQIPRSSLWHNRGRWVSSSSRWSKHTAG